MANPTRRTVLRTGALVAGAAVPLGAVGQALSVVPGGAGGLARSAFSPHVGRAYRIVGAGGTYTAVLKKVADLKGAARGHDSRFRLEFDVRGGSAPEGTYSFHRGRLDRSELFIAPIGAKPGRYEAVIYAR